MKKEICFLCLLLLFNSKVFCDEKNVLGGVLDFNIYPYLSDVDNDAVVTVNIAAQLKNGFSYASLTNFYNEEDAAELEDTTSFYTEQNIRWQIPNTSFDLTTQMNFRSGKNNDRHRLGVRWRMHDSELIGHFFEQWHLKWSINLHAIQFDHTSENEWQIEHVFFLKMPYLSNRLYLAGFIDHTFGEDLPDDYPSSPIVAEAQLGWRLVENLYLVTEYRINEYRRSDVNNLAVGIEYKLLW